MLSLLPSVRDRAPRETLVAWFDASTALRLGAVFCDGDGGGGIDEFERELRAALEFADPPLLWRGSSGGVASALPTLPAARLIDRRLEAPARRRFFQQFVTKFCTSRRRTFDALSSRFARMFVPQQTALVRMHSTTAQRARFRPLVASSSSGVGGGGAKLIDSIREATVPVLRRRRQARLARRRDPLGSLNWLNISPSKRRALILNIKTEAS